MEHARVRELHILGDGLLAADACNTTVSQGNRYPIPAHFIRSQYLTKRTKALHHGKTCTFIGHVPLAKRVGWRVGRGPDRAALCASGT